MVPGCDEQIQPAPELDQADPQRPPGGDGQQPVGHDVAEDSGLIFTSHFICHLLTGPIS
jgi:hypothetical protein